MKKLRLVLKRRSLSMPFTFNPVIIIGFVGLKSSSSRMRLVPICGKSSFSHQLNVTSIKWRNAIELLSFNGSYQSSQAGLGYAKNPLKRLYCSTVCIGFTTFSMYINLTLLSFGMTARRLVITVRWSSVIETILSLKLLRVLVQAHSKSIAPTGSGRYEDLAPIRIYFGLCIVSDNLSSVPVKMDSIISIIYFCFPSTSFLGARS